ncbi:MAG: hypothetical protein ACO1NS_08100 [Daejeonella sp.]
MATHKISTSFISTSIPDHTQKEGFASKYLDFVDGQKANSIAWWLGSLLLHGCILVPLTFLFVYSTGGPTGLFLTISMVAFFVNVIANMGGAGFRFTFNSLVVSVIIHLVMIVLTIINIL